MSNARDVPPEINAAMQAFHDELIAWLEEGGDRRLVEFKPLAAWHRVTGLMANQRDTSDSVRERQDRLRRMMQ